MRFVIYSGSGCPNCEVLKSWLDMNDLKYEEFNVREDEHAMKFLKGNGYSSIPQVYLNGKHITGFHRFKPNLLEAINGGG